MLLLLASLAHAVPTLAFDGECPGPILIDIDGLSPGASVVLLKGSGPGGERIPGGPCADVDSGLAGPLSWFGPFRDADRDGFIGLRPSIPEPACGAHFTAVELGDCGVSTVEQMPEVGGAEDDPDCAANPLWTPVTCDIDSWVWSSDRVGAATIEAAEASYQLWTGCNHSGDGNEDGMCSLDGTGWVSVDIWPMAGCDAEWWHLGGSYTGNCGGHDSVDPVDFVRRLVTTDLGCYDYRDLPIPGE